MSRKWPTIDIVKLFYLGDQVNWQATIQKYIKNNDLEAIKKTRYGIQAGMEDARKQKLNTPVLINWFAQIQRDLDVATKLILKKLYPSPLDEPLKAVEFRKNNPKDLVDKVRKEKQERDDKIERYIRENSF